MTQPCHCEKPEGHLIQEIGPPITHTTGSEDTLQPLKMQLLVFICCAVALTSAAKAEKDQVPVFGLIIDTDMSTDCDDVGAVCVANALADNGEVNLLAVVHNTGLPEGAGAISVLNTYYGRQVIDPEGNCSFTLNRSLTGTLTGT